MNTAVSCEKLIVTPFVGDIVTVNFKKLSEYVKNEAQSLIYLVNYDSETKDFDISNLKGLPKEDCPFSKPLKALAQMKKFEAKPGSLLECTVDIGESLCFSSLFGVSKKSKAMDYKEYGQTIGEAITKQNVKVTNLISLLNLFESKEHLTTFLVGVYMGLGEDKRYKKNRKTDYKFDTVNIYSKESINDVTEAINNAKYFAHGSDIARQLVTSPSNYSNTINLSQYFAELASSLGMNVKILEKADCERLGMGSYLSVAKGSQYPPKFVHAQLNTEDCNGKFVKVALLGKGLTFDSGGYNMKSAASKIELMKMDMGGFAAICGAMLTLAKIKPKGLQVHFLSPLCENMVSAASYRPGDIITASNGKTIEVLNTDAEGRLALADGLVYAEKLGVDVIIDIATLTGAAIVALGEKYAAYYTDSETMNQHFQKGLDLSGEKAWRMPIVKEYSKQLESKVADLQNIASPNIGGGSIVAAVFLKEFVDKTPWIHFDIAGPASCGTLGTGFGANTLAAVVKSLSDDLASKKDTIHEL
ncbi:leucyl aminopeptidase [Babesia microti strain RI]|uniref:Leucyl aminopeptidase n=1 Tax=Babesia microti (strain RI) TaxID=1133968 RepID=A0A1R4AAX6_BABMR|nr:leucyl aminopeptidase [Babesia microti strain RI]SJK86156.1 leucyl aminopeptidase [Babesia microti strain RI]|eukprot:XP_021338349.1 leucyl aminopeptidase [Babesia microti strain RI]